LVVRDDGDSSSSSSPTASAPASKQTPFSTNLNTGGITQTESVTEPTGDGSTSFTGTAAPTATFKGNSTNKHTTFDPTNPAGGVVMTQPALIDGPQYYKIRDYITLGWNYTNLLAAPTAIDILLTMATPAATYTIASNMTFESQASFTFDTQAYQTDHPGQLLPQSEVTLVIYDAESNPTTPADPGYLGPFNGLKFGLYYPKKPVDLQDWVCATCSGAMPSLDRKGLGTAVIMSLMTVLSFTWFVTGF
jgi:hypothetical protein